MTEQDLSEMQGNTESDFANELKKLEAQTPKSSGGDAEVQNKGEPRVW